MLADQYASAEKLCVTLRSAAKKSKDNSLIKRAEARSKNVGSLAGQFPGLNPAFQAVQQNPIDLAANLALGKFYCLVKGDWPKGLPFLARSGDTDLQELARQEEVRPALAADEVRLGDAYWTLSDVYSDSGQQQLRARAGYWYKQAQGSLTGLTKARIAKRLSRIEPAPDGAEFIEAVAPTNLSGIWESSNEGMLVRLFDDGSEIRVELIRGDKLSHLDAAFVRAGDRFIVKRWGGNFKTDFDSSGETRSLTATVSPIDDTHLRVLTDKVWIESGEITRKVRLGARYIWTKIGEAPAAEQKPAP